MIFELLNHHRDARHNEDRSFAIEAVEFEPCRLLSDHAVDSEFEFRQVLFGTQRDLVCSVNKLLAQSTSLSVDDAPDGAGVGTSESTERGQTPTLSEKEMPSAVAPAEGDETKNQ